MADRFASHAPNLTAPASDGAALVPSDAAALAEATRAVYVGTGGDLHVRFVSGADVTLRNLAGGMIYPLRLNQVLATGTTATNLVALR
ncbi:spike base protein, RCAP_Rcc01079 family [Frigidibacter sp. MR17.24]|uniref:spike base protein, RCAP_Rcc01079 family n=1 Tax=Frigidibacter sp. MR17.24 TaxID=3127345 RepID=UPI003012DFFB